MPNNVTNRLTVQGPQDQILALIKLMSTSESSFDFNAILPMPKELRDVNTGSITIDDERVERWRRVASDDGTFVDVKIPDEELLRWRTEYGATDWYQWSIKNWGTKWSAYRVDEAWKMGAGSRRASIKFDTAWGPPEKVYEAIVAKFPDLLLTVRLSGEWDGPEFISFDKVMNHSRGRKT